MKTNKLSSGKATTNLLNELKISDVQAMNLVSHGNLTESGREHDTGGESEKAISVN